MSFFITGTDTGIGKTALATAIALGLQAQEKTVAPMKPVQTGCEANPSFLQQSQAPDLNFALSRLKHPFEKEMLPYAFEPACSPHLAAERARQCIELPVITNAFAALQNRYEHVIVEGAGGVLVPLNPTHTMLDLMTELDLPVILAARPALGTLNHTLMSVQVLRDAGLTIAGFATIDTAPTTWSFIEEDNLATLIQRGNITHLGHMTFNDALPIDFLTEFGLQVVDGLS